MASCDELVALLRFSPQCWRFVVTYLQIVGRAAREQRGSRREWSSTRITAIRSESKLVDSTVSSNFGREPCHTTRCRRSFAIFICQKQPPPPLITRRSTRVLAATAPTKNAGAFGVIRVRNSTKNIRCRSGMLDFTGAVHELTAPRGERCDFGVSSRPSFEFSPPIHFSSD